MRTKPLFPMLAALSITVSACSSRPVTVADHPPLVDLDPRTCGLEPLPPTDDQFERDPLAPQKYEVELIGWGRCRVDKEMRVCQWHELRKAKDDSLTCSLPKRPE